MFAVVVIGGLNSLLGAIVAGFALGIIEGLTKVFYPRRRAQSIFMVMVVVLLIKPAGLSRHRRAGRAEQHLGAAAPANRSVILAMRGRTSSRWCAFAAPFLFYPLFVTQTLCYAIFGLSFNLLLGYGGLMSFGHAAFLAARPT